MRSTDRTEVMQIESQSVLEAALDLFGEDAVKTVYATETEAMGRRLIMLGLVIEAILTLYPCGKELLRRVFEEQYEKDDKGVVTLRDKKKVKADSLQNPNDPEAGYQCKNGKKVKGYATNITETTDQKAVKNTEEVTGNHIEKLHADVVYQSEDNRMLASGKRDGLNHGFEFVANSIQGKQPRYRLSMNEYGTLTVINTDT